jgi:hypothetical protein
MAAAKHSKKQSKSSTNRRTPDPKDEIAKSSNPQVAPQSANDFLQRLTSDPEFRRMNPNVRFIDGRLEHVAPKPPKKVVPLPDPVGKRHKEAIDEAVSVATHHLLSILNVLPALVAMDCGEEPTPESLPVSDWSDVIMALVVRSRDVTSAMAYALDGEVSADNLRRMVMLGDMVDHESGERQAAGAS